MIYRFTLCERGGVEIASCRLTCDAEFADGFERAMYLRIDDDSQYIVRESIGERARKRVRAPRGRRHLCHPARVEPGTTSGFSQVGELAGQGLGLEGLELGLRDGATVEQALGLLDLSSRPAPAALAATFWT